MTAATRPARPSEPPTRTIPAPAVVVPGVVEPVPAALPVPVPAVPPVVDAEPVPAEPPAAAAPGEMVVAVVASFLKAAREREALAAVLFVPGQYHDHTRSLSLQRQKTRNKKTNFSLITMTMPAWQCLPCAQ